MSGESFIDVGLQPENTRPFVDEGDWNELVNNDINLQGRLSVMESFYASGSVPLGGIMLWYGLESAVPTGFQICDGTNGLPDLRGKFVMGAETDEEILAAGGAEAHVHSNPNTGSGGGHSHSVEAVATNYGSSSISLGAGTEGFVTWISHTHWISIGVGSAGSHSHSLGQTESGLSLPPYKKLYWIGRVVGG